MSLIREHYTNREEWLANRKYIGGSEVAAALGLSPFMTNVELWEYKTGARQPKDLSGNAAVEYGVRMEPVLRALYAAEHPEMIVEHYPFDILRQDNIPYLGVTLDGELTERSSGRKGILEIKAVQATSRIVWEKWRNKVPTHYFCQVLSQMLATGWHFVDLLAYFRKLDGDGEVRCYRFEREEQEPSIKWIDTGLSQYWEKYIVTGIRPPMILPDIL